MSRKIVGGFLVAVGEPPPAAASACAVAADMLLLLVGLKGLNMPRGIISWNYFILFGFFLLLEYSLG